MPRYSDEKRGKKRAARKVAALFQLIMSSRFEYPINSGSLGSPRRPTSFASSFPQPAVNRFARDKKWAAILPTQPRPCVLVVEDNDDSLFMLKSILNLKGYRVVEAWDGKQAVEVAETEELDLILLDLQLPRLNGLGVIHRLRQNAKLQNVPVVIVTGQDPEKYRSHAIAEGCDDFLVKPIDFDRLDAILDYYVPIEAVA